jgi:hypothetical protein
MTTAGWFVVVELDLQFSPNNKGCAVVRNYMLVGTKE